MWNRQVREDARSLAIISGSAMVAVLLTAGAGFAYLRSKPPRVVREVRVAPMIRVAPVRVKVTPSVKVVPGSGINRLYGEVVTVDGDRLTGFIRWDKNEGSWADILDATKVEGSGSGSSSGIRFGHVLRIEPLGSERARITLRNGEEVELRGQSTDLGSAVRGIRVDGEDGRSGEVRWHSLASVEFKAPPSGTRPPNARLWGTLTTRSGMEFTGYVTWDVDEIYNSDILDGEENGVDRDVTFGDIQSIERYSSSAARVLLRNGREMILRGTNDVDDSNNGIAVSDPALGQVLVDWREFASVSFSEPPEEIPYGRFGDEGPIRGTVTTVDGREYQGPVVWDADESFTWELLDGDAGGADFAVEFGNIARIIRRGAGVTVELRDGRSFDLTGSNDVTSGNRGIFVWSDGSAHRVSWPEFEELRLEP